MYNQGRSIAMPPYPSLESRSWPKVSARRTLFAASIFLVFTATPVTAIDTDRDEMTDAFETANGFDPMDADGVIDGRDDSDSDDLGNAAEDAIGTDPNLADTDGDGLDDGFEIGTGTFSLTPTFIGAVVQPSGGTPADLDGDGDFDYVMADFFGVVAIARNLDGEGSFSAIELLALTEAGEGLAVGDIDGDDDLDVLSERGNELFLWKNTDGLGNFAALQTIATTPPFLSGMSLGDLDGDDDLDLLLGGSDVRRLDNTDGLGTFGSLQVLFAGVPSAEAADLDRDGDLDVLAGGNWYENTDGMGTLGSPVALPSGAGQPTDIDGDGDLDLLNAGSEVGWHEDTTGSQSFGSEKPIATGFLSARLLGADLDSDGDTDLLAAVRYLNGPPDGLVWFENLDGAGAFGALQYIAANQQNTGSLSAVDVDGDGDADPIFNNQAGFNGDFLWVEQMNVANPLLVDSDGDGADDANEVLYGSDPLDPEDVPGVPALGRLGIFGLAALAAGIVAVSRRQGRPRTRAAP
jgi:hypothetical protein